MDQIVDKHTFTAIVAVDDSARAQDVVRAGAAYVRALRGTIVLYRGILVPPDFTPAGMQDRADLEEYLTQQAISELNVLRTLTTDVSCELQVSRADH